MSTASYFNKCFYLNVFTKLWVGKCLPKKLLKSLSGLFSAAELSDRTGDVIAYIISLFISSFGGKPHTGQRRPQARCINYRVFQNCFAFYERFKDFV